jgi:hypothetical protein
MQKSGTLWIAMLVTGTVLQGCANPQDQLARAERHYQDARYEAALTNLEDLEIHLSKFGTRERIRYEVAYGMAHLRLGQRADDHRCTDSHHCAQARHWLALARAEADLEPDAVTESAKSTITRTLAGLDPASATQDPAAASSGGASAGNSTTATSTTSTGTAPGTGAGTSSSDRSVTP